MATTQAQIHQTNFEVGSTKVRFGLLWPDGSFLMTDWARESRVQEIAGASDFTETQLLGFGPYKVSYAIFLETVADYRSLDTLVQQTGTLTVVHDGHTVPIDSDEPLFIGQVGLAYDRLAGVTLLSLVSSGVAPDGTVEATALFSRPSS